MPTFFQKLSLAFRGWQRRRAEAQNDFVNRNASWGVPAPAIPKAPPQQPGAKPQSAIDLEGLQVAFLDDSGQIDYYLDTSSGDVVEVRGDARVNAMPASFKLVPRRSAESEAADRSAFVATLDDTATRGALANAVKDGAAFRAALANDRAIERAWYNFKNDRASKAIAEWVRSL